jgi:hypothetical protein
MSRSIYSQRPGGPLNDDPALDRYLENYENLSEEERENLTEEWRRSVAPQEAKKRRIKVRHPAEKRAEVKKQRAKVRRQLMKRRTETKIQIVRKTKVECKIEKAYENYLADQLGPIFKKS